MTYHIVLEVGNGLFTEIYIDIRWFLALLFEKKNNQDSKLTDLDKLKISALNCKYFLTHNF